MKRLQAKVLKVSSFQNLLTFFSIHTLIDKTKAQKKEEKDKASKADDPKAGADVGKIVNLIAGDSNRVWNITCFTRLLLISHFRFLERHLRSIFSTEVRIILFLRIRQHRIHTLLAPFEILIGGLFLYQSVGRLYHFF